MSESTTDSVMALPVDQKINQAADVPKKLTIKEFCIHHSANNKDVTELLGAFHHHQIQRENHSDTHESFSEHFENFKKLQG